MLSPSFAADKPWQQLRTPGVDEVAASFQSPPPEYGATVTWGWNGPMSAEVITRDLDMFHARGLRAVTIEAGYRMDNAPYLTDGWFELIRLAAEEADKRGMRIWIIDEGKYPSGFAGGKYSQERPDLRMQGLAVAERIEVATGDAVNRELPPEVVGVIAMNTATGANHPVDIANRRLQFTAPSEGSWQLLLVDHQFRTPVTRAVNDPTGAKTTANSMGNLIDPEGGRQFIEWTHEQYRKHMGDLFGTVIMGFRGDEADYGHTPWTSGIVELFQERKGYDVRPYLAYFVSLPRNAGQLQLTDAQRRAKADYWDLWSDLFAENFFTMQSEWSAKNGVEHTTHLNNDHNMPGLVRSTGDFFKAMRHVQIPGVDVIWNQVWPGKVADFVKYASSAAHLNGRPRALSESYAAYTPPPNLDQVQFGVNYQLVRGINLFEFMFQGSSAPRVAEAQPAPAPAPAAANAERPERPRRYMEEPGFVDIATYTNRAQYLLAQGRPAAQIAVYYPTSSLWLGNNDANTATMTIAQQLLERQYDFDFVDDYALAESLQAGEGTLKNQSGQSYRAVIIPAASAISRKALERLQAFARSGGRVIFTGGQPEMIVERSFLAAKPPGDLSWATLRVDESEITPAVLAALPPSDVVFDQPASAIKVMHRRLRDADVYFLFNESEESLQRQVTLEGQGAVQRWNPATGTIEAVRGFKPGNRTVTVPVELAGHEAQVIVVRSGSAARVAQR